MGSVIYDFLTESLLFDNNLISDKFRGVDEQELFKSLEDYREFVLSSLKTIEEEAKENESSTKIFSGRRTSLDLLKQAAFYVDQFIVPDPLFSLTVKPSQINENMRQYLKMSKIKIDRVSLASAVAYLKELTPAVAVNYVKIIPLSLLFEPPPQIPIHFSDNQFASASGTEALEHFRQNAIVKSLTRCNDGWIETADFFPCRSIAIRFMGHAAADARMFLLFRPGRQVLNEQTRLAKIEMTLPDDPPDSDEFNSWVLQSIYDTAINSYRRIATEISLGTSCGASYLCESSFAFDLLGKELRVRQDLNEHTATAVLNLELPFLDKVDLATLMRVRTDDGEAFENFRLELESKLRDLRLEKDPESITEKAKNAMHEICEVQIQRVESKITSLRKSALAESVVFIAGLAGAVQSGGWSILGSIMALAQGFRTYENYNRNVRENPSYFLWKVLRKSGRPNLSGHTPGSGEEIGTWVYTFDPQAIAAVQEKEPTRPGS